MALTTDTSILTAVGNDYGFDRIFSRQIEALGGAGDMAQTSVKGPFRFQNNRRLNSWKVGAEGVTGEVSFLRAKRPLKCDLHLYWPTDSWD